MVVITILLLVFVLPSEEACISRVYDNGGNVVRRTECHHPTENEWDS